MVTLLLGPGAGAIMMGAEAERQRREDLARRCAQAVCAPPGSPTDFIVLWSLVAVVTLLLGGLLLWMVRSGRRLW